MTAVLPSPSQPIAIGGEPADPSYYIFFQNIWYQLGGTTNTNIAQVADTANTALVDANRAQSTANTALITANAAQVAAATAQSTANTANAGVNAISKSLASFLNKNNNLSDVSSVFQSRLNLGIGAIALGPVSFDICPSNLIKIIPIIQDVSIPANLAGSVIYAGVVPTANTTFNVGYISGPAASIINFGTIGLVHSGNYPLLSGTAVILQAGSALAITAPTIPDATLAQVGITIAADIL